MYYDFLYQSNANGTEGFYLCSMGVSSPSTPYNIYGVTFVQWGVPCIVA